MAFGIVDADRAYLALETELLSLADHASLARKLTYALWCCRSITDTLGDEISFAIEAEGKNLLDDINLAVKGHLFHQEANVKEELEGYGAEFEALNLEDSDDKSGYEAFLCLSAIDAMNCSAALISLFLSGDNSLVVTCAVCLAAVVEHDAAFLEDYPSASEKIKKAIDYIGDMARLMLQNDVTEEQFEDSILVITHGVELHNATQLRLGARG